MKKEQIKKIYERLKTEVNPSERSMLRYLLNVQYGKFGSNKQSQDHSQHKPSE